MAYVWDGTDVADGVHESGERRHFSGMLCIFFFQVHEHGVYQPRHLITLFSGSGAILIRPPCVEIHPKLLDTS